MSTARKQVDWEALNAMTQHFAESLCAELITYLPATQED